MITHEQDENGNWVELSEERKRRLNEEVLSLDPIRQAEIEDIESGASVGDVHEVSLEGIADDDEVEE